MNENLKQFIEGTGIMCETWIIMYNNFLKLGLTQKDALMHTREMMSVMYEAMTGNSNGDGNV